MSNILPQIEYDSQYLKNDWQPMETVKPANFNEISRVTKELVDNNNNLELNLGNVSVRQFANIENMKQSNNLKVGDLVKTQGFYTAGDGGGADYVVTDNIGEDEVDEASIIALQKGLYAKLLAENYINVKWFGAKFDDTTDDTEAIQKAINFCSNKNNSGTVIFPPLKKAIITKTLTLPIGVSIQGNKSLLRTTENIDWFIEYAKDSPAPAGDKTTNAVYNFKATIRDLCLDSKNSGNINNGILVYNNINIINLSTLGLNFSIKKKEDIYTDFLIIKGVLIGYKRGEDYALTLNALGDGNIIEDVHTWYSDENINAISVSAGVQPIFIKNIINGNISIRDGAFAKLEKIHIEYGQIEIKDRAFASIDTAHIWKQPNAPIIKINNSASVSLNNIHSCYYGGRINYRNDECIDIQFEGFIFNLNMQNCFKKLLGKHLFPPSPLYGIKTNSNKFNRNRTTLSKMCVSSGRVFFTPMSTVSTYAPYTPIIGTLFTDPNIEWEEDITNVSYTGTLLFDEDRKLACLSRKYSTESIDVTKGGNMVGINLNAYINSPIVLVRNSNKKIVVAPIQTVIFDTGYMCGGEVWEDYNSTLEEDYQNCYGVEYNPQLNRDNIIAYMDNVPTKGTWLRGDIVKKYYPNSGQTFSWICISDGTPGTWKELTTIQA